MRYFDPGLVKCEATAVAAFKDGIGVTGSLLSHRQRNGRLGDGGRYRVPEMREVGLACSHRRGAFSVLLPEVPTGF